MRTQPHKGYSTKAWNPPRNWVSPERIALAGIPAVPQIVIEQITADVSTPAITTIESVFVEDQVIGEAIAKFNRTNTNVFISGDLSVEDFDTSVLPRDPYQFKFIEASPSNIKLEAAPLKTVIKFLGDEFASGSLQVRSIVSSQ